MKRILNRLMSIACMMFGVALIAQVVPDPTDSIRLKEYFHRDFAITNVYGQISDLPQAQAAGLVDALESVDLPVDHARLDPRSAKWGTLITSIPLVPGSGMNNNLSWKNMGYAEPSGQAAFEENAWIRFIEFLQLHEAGLGINIYEIANLGKVTSHNNGDVVQIYAPREIDGIPVRSSYVNAVINHGNLVLFGAHYWGNIDLNTEPTLSENAARDVVETYLAELSPNGLWKESELVIVPMSKDAEFGDGYAYRLAWAINPGFSRSDQYEALVDAHSGELIAFQDMTDYLADPPKEEKAPRAATLGSVIGGAYPVSNDQTPPDGVEVSNPMPFLDVEVDGKTLTTNSGGNIITCIDGTTMTASLSGPHVIIGDVCGASLESSTSGTLDFGSGTNPSDTNCTVAAGRSPGNTKSARTAFYEINRIMELGRAHLPSNTFLTDTMQVNVNINQTCNANSGGLVLNFYRSGGGCNNTGELAGVFDHEWGHSMDRFDATSGISNPGEGIADIYASLRLKTSCIGRGFRGSNCGGYGDPCLDCTGVRDIDWAKRVSGQPHDVTWVDSHCGSGGSTPCGGSTHCEGSAYAEAVYDLWNRDLTAAPFNMDSNRALEIAARLTFVGAGAVGTWYQCVQGEGGASAGSGYMNFLAADDDDGNLSNGTPHMSAIYAAFNRHGIATANLTVQNSGCPSMPTVAPVVTGVALNQGADISWGAVANAVAYRVYRTEGVFDCEFGKLPLIETADLTFRDSGLRNDREYYYTVAAIGASDTCIGPMSDCTTVVPTSAATPTDIGVGNILTAINSGDGDDFIDNCESVSTTFNVFAFGPMTNVQITDIRALNSPNTVIQTSLPVGIGDLGAQCTSSLAGFDFRPQDLTFGGTLTFEVDFTSPETGTITKSFSYDHTETDISGVQNATYSFESSANGWVVGEGTFNQTTAGGGANGSAGYMASSTLQDDQCDHIQSPPFYPTSTTTLSFFTKYDTEDWDGSTWWDRANIGVYEVESDTRTVISPDGGRLYPITPGNVGVRGVCGTTGQVGYAGVAQPWASSTFTSTAFNASTFEGNQVMLDVRYGTDGGANGVGFWFDEVQLSNVHVLVADVQDDVCGCLGVSIAAQSGDESVCEGDDIELFVQVTGTNPGYQWRKDEHTILGEEGSTLSLTGVTPDDAASYDCVITGDCGSTTSAPSVLTVGAALNPANFQYQIWNTQDECADSNGDLIVNVLDFIEALVPLK